MQKARSLGADKFGHLAAAQSWGHATCAAAPSIKQKDITMGQPIDQFCEDLRLKLTNIDNTLGALRAKIDVKAPEAEQDVRSQLEKSQKRIEQDHIKLGDAKREVSKWIEERRTMTRENLAEWKAKLETSKLQRRADNAERYAAAASLIALAAVDGAERAAVEAWLARHDAA
jgi:hypothetical protein